MEKKLKKDILSKRSTPANGGESAVSTPAKVHVLRSNKKQDPVNKDKSSSSGSRSTDNLTPIKPVQKVKTFKNVSPKPSGSECIGKNETTNTNRLKRSKTTKMTGSVKNEAKLNNIKPKTSDSVNRTPKRAEVLKTAKDFTPYAKSKKTQVSQSNVKQSIKLNDPINSKEKINIKKDDNNVKKDLKLTVDNSSKLYRTDVLNVEEKALSADNTHFDTPGDNNRETVDLNECKYKISEDNLQEELNLPMLCHQNSDFAQYDVLNKLDQTNKTSDSLKLLDSNELSSTNKLVNLDESVKSNEPIGNSISVSNDWIVTDDRAATIQELDTDIKSEVDTAIELGKTIELSKLNERDETLMVETADPEKLTEHDKAEEINQLKVTDKLSETEIVELGRTDNITETNDRSNETNTPNSLFIDVNLNTELNNLDENNEIYGTGETDEIVEIEKIIESNKIVETHGIMEKNPSDESTDNNIGLNNSDINLNNKEKDLTNFKNVIIKDKIQNLFTHDQKQNENDKSACDQNGDLILLYDNKESSKEYNSKELFLDHQSISDNNSGSVSFSNQKFIKETGKSLDDNELKVEDNLSDSDNNSASFSYSDHKVTRKYSNDIKIKQIVESDQKIFTKGTIIGKKQDSNKSDNSNTKLEKLSGNKNDTTEPIKHKLLATPPVTKTSPSTFTYNSPPFIIRNHFGKSGESAEILVYKLGSHSTPRKVKGKQYKSDWGTPQTNYFPFHKFSHNVISKKVNQRTKVANKLKVLSRPSALVKPVKINFIEKNIISKNYKTKNTNVKNTEQSKNDNREIGVTKSVKSLINKFENLTKQNIKTTDDVKGEVKTFTKNKNVSYKRKLPTESDELEIKTFTKNKNVSYKRKFPTESDELDTLDLSNIPSCSSQSAETVNKKIKTEGFENSVNTDFIFRDSGFADTKSFINETCEIVSNSFVQPKEDSINYSPSLQKINPTIDLQRNDFQRIEIDQGSSINLETYEESGVGRESSELCHSMENKENENSHYKEDCSNKTPEKTYHRFQNVETPLAQSSILENDSSYTSQTKDISLDDTMKTNESFLDEKFTLNSSLKKNASNDSGRFLPNNSFSQEVDSPTFSISKLFTLAEDLRSSPIYVYNEYRQKFYEKLETSNSSI